MLESPTIVLLHASATLYMTGLIWFVQIVHYPLFNRADRRQFVAFEKEHQRLTSRVVAAPMLIELVTAAFLLWKIPGTLTTCGFSLLLVIWLSTLCFQIPAHNRLATQFEEATHRKLVRTNWIRTIAWTLRSVLAMWLAAG